MDETLLRVAARQAKAEAPETNVLTVRAGMFAYPDDHTPGMRVPKGGSMCANCQFLVVTAPGGPACIEPNFVAAELSDKPAGTGRLPAPPDSYCSDWWRAVSMPEVATPVSPLDVAPTPVTP